MKISQSYNYQYFEKRDHLAPPLAEAINIFAKENGLKKILDVGCGTGRMIKYLNQKGFRAKGCDISPNAVRFTNRINNKKVAKIGAATQIRYVDGSFDLVIMISVIEHLTPKEARKFLSESNRVLKPGGFIFLVTPNFATPLRFIQGKKWFGYSDPTHINFYTPLGLGKLLKEFKFKKIKTLFKTNRKVSFAYEFPYPLSATPKILMPILIYLLFTTPAAYVKNSFWISAQKPNGQ